jgi:hypothetical protein
MNTPVLNYWISVMYGELEYPPGSFIPEDVTSTLVPIHLIPSVSLLTFLCRRLNFKHCFIAAFVYIFADMFDGLCRVAELHIYMCGEHLG